MPQNPVGWGPVTSEQAARLARARMAARMSGFLRDMLVSVIGDAKRYMPEKRIKCLFLYINC